MTKERKEEKASEEQAAKEELNLVEYPLTLLSRRAPAGAKTIEYTDWVTVGGEKRQLKWTVTGSDKFGLPIGGDQDVYMVIMQTWKENGFKDPVIPIGSIYRMLKKMGSSTHRKDYQRFKQSLDRWTGLYITTENAFWDKEGQRYHAKRGFRVFDDYYLLERFPKTATMEPLPFGYVRASDFIFQSIKKGYLKEVDFRFYFSLPTPLTKRLYRYLDKKKYLTDTFTMELYKFASKIGLLVGGSEKYYPSKIRQILDPALNELKSKGFLKDYSYQKTADGKGQKIVFLFSQLPAKVIPPTEEDEIELLIEDILAVCKDRHSEPFYKKVSQLLPEQVVRRAISEVKASVLQGEVKTSPGKLFTHLIKKYAKDFGIKL